MTQTKSTIVLLHGYMGHPQDWDATVARLSDNFHCILPQLSVKTLTMLPPGEAGFNDYCSQLFQEIDQQFELPETFNLLGYSMGGRIALSWSAQFKDRFQHLILESCHPGLVSAQEKQQRFIEDIKWQRKFLQKDCLEQSLTEWYQQPVFDSLSNASKYHLVQSRLRDLTANDIGMISAVSLGIQPSFWNLETKIPTAYFSGKKDSKYTEIAQKLKANNPELVHCQFMHSGHNIHNHETERFCAQINQLINGTQ